MVKEILMPKLGETMKEGVITKWLKEEGDQIKKGEAIVEIDIEKIVTEITAPESGILLKKIAQEGEAVPVKGIIGIIGELGEESNFTEIVNAEKKKINFRNTFKVPVENSNKEGINRKIKASPAARKLARDKGVELADVPPTEPNGSYTKQDVISWIKEHEEDILIQKNMKNNYQIKLGAINLIMAKKMTKSFSEKPHVTLVREISVEALVDFKKVNWQNSISFNVFILKICSLALKQFPLFNGHIDDNEITSFIDINIGIAVDSKKGLVVPVIKDVYNKNLLQLNIEYRDLIGRAKINNLTEKDFNEGTFTITNLGSYNIDIFNPIINPPEIAILGIGKIVDKPIVDNKTIKISPMMNLCLSFDHRAVDGSTAAKFLNKICEYILNPKLLVY